MLKAVRRDAAVDGKAERERCALDGGGAGGRERQARVLHRAGVTLDDESADVVLRADTESVSAALRGRTGEHTGSTQSQARRQRATAERVGIRCCPAGGGQRLTEGRTRRQGWQRGRRHDDRRCRRGDGDIEGELVTVFVFKRECVGGRRCTVVGVGDRLVTRAALGTEDDRAVGRQERREGSAHAEIERTIAGGQIDRCHRSAIGDRHALRRAIRRYLRRCQGGPQQNREEQPLRAEENGETRRTRADNGLLLHFPVPLKIGAHPECR